MGSSDDPSSGASGGTPFIPRSLGFEIVAVFSLQILALIALVRLDRAGLIGGAAQVLVGAMFVALPLAVLDRRGKPYERYAMRLGKPFGDLAWALFAMAVAFVPVALVSPYVWGVDSRSWSFVLPAGYPGVALAHVVLVAIPEEFFYRGYLMGRLDDLFGARGRFRLLGAEVGPSLFVQAALFAVCHFAVDLRPGRLAVFFPALAFGWLKTRRRSLTAPVLFHAGSNVFMDLLRAGLGLA